MAKKRTQSSPDGQTLVTSVNPGQDEERLWSVVNSIVPFRTSVDCNTCSLSADTVIKHVVLIRSKACLVKISATANIHDGVKQIAWDALIGCVKLPLLF